MPESEVTIGDDVIIECTATGVPLPVLTWKKDGEDLVNGSGSIIGVPQLLSDGSILSVLEIVGTDTGDGGQYTCTATNHVGNMSQSIELDLLGKWKMSMHFLRKINLTSLSL